MFSVALIGPDGAGKTTIGHMVLEASPLPVKYLYMGINIEASNYALPSSRFVGYLRRLKNGKQRTSPTQHARLSATTESLARKLWAAASLSNRLAEEWYRQTLSWAYQAQGYIVLYDRHFSFDFSLDGVDAGEPSLDTRMHQWFLNRWYPSPDLVIYLDAPAEVLFARKGEKSVEELERRRQAFLRKREQHPHFIVVDATEPCSKVCAQVIHCMLQFRESRRYREGKRLAPDVSSEIPR